MVCRRRINTFRHSITFGTFGTPVSGERHFKCKKKPDNIDAEHNVAYQLTQMVWKRSDNTVTTTAPAQNDNLI